MTAAYLHASLTTKKESPDPFDAARADVASAMQNEQFEIDALRAKAKTLAASPCDRGDFAELGLSPRPLPASPRDGARCHAAPKGSLPLCLMQQPVM